jgi:hypothetical protein
LPLIPGIRGVESTMQGNGASPFRFLSSIQQIAREFSGQSVKIYPELFFNAFRPIRRRITQTNTKNWSFLLIFIVQGYYRRSIFA